MPRAIAPPILLDSAVIKPLVSVRGVKCSGCNRFIPPKEVYVNLMEDSRGFRHLYSRSFCQTCWGSKQIAWEEEAKEQVQSSQKALTRLKALREMVKTVRTQNSIKGEVKLTRYDLIRAQA